MPCLNATSTGLFCQLRVCTDGRSHLLLITDVTMLTVPLVHVNFARSVHCNFSSITTMMVTHSFFFSHFLPVLRVGMCLSAWNISPSLLLPLSLSICLLIFKRALRVNVFECELLCLCGTCVMRCGTLCVCVMGVPLKSCCCLPLRQCLVSAARLGWTGSPSPLPPAYPSPPITFPTAKPCRMTTQRAATTCCHTLTWRGTKTLGVGWYR